MKNTSGTVNKALVVLEAFLDHGTELSLGDISEITGYNRATVFRLVSTLVQNGYLYQPQRKGKYGLGLKPLELSYASRSNLHYLDTIYAHLSKLCREHTVAINITLFQSENLIVIDEIGIAKDFRITALVGKRLPLHATAAGKVILAGMTDERRRALLDRHALTPYTDNTLTDLHLLEKELEKVRKDGIAFDHEEYISGTWATASPVYWGKQILVVNSVVAPSSQIDADRARQLSIALKNSTVEISYVLNRAFH